MSDPFSSLSPGVTAMLGAFMLGALFIVFLGVTVVMEQRRKIAQTREREASRREIAAYVAEGSISAADAARLLNDKGKSLGDAISDTFS